MSCSEYLMLPENTHNMTYYVKVYYYFKNEQKYGHTKNFYPGKCELHFEKDALHSGYKKCKRLRRRKPGFFNPFNKNFLSYEYQEAIENFAWIADCLTLKGEHPLIPVEDRTRNIEIASFKDLTPDIIKDEEKYTYLLPLYTLVINGKEYDRDMLKKNIDRFNAILENGYVQNCLNVLD